MEKTEALNTLLRAIGSHPVNDYETKHPSAANGRAVLDRVRKRLNRRTWWYNVDYNVTYQPDPVTKEIILPAEVQRLVVATVGQGTLAGGYKHIVKRGNKLYDNLTQSYQFDYSVTVRSQTRDVSWEELPETAQSYIVNEAAIEYVRDELSDSEKVDEFKQLAGKDLIDLQEENLEQGQYNVFCTPRIAQARAGVFPYHRNRIIGVGGLR